MNKNFTNAQTYLKDLGALDTNNLPTILTLTADSISKAEITEGMRRIIALSELTLFAGTFQRKITLWDGTLVPINSLTFLLADSGENKDRSAKGIRKCFNAGYDLIHTKRLSLAKSTAIKLASNDGADNPHSEENWKPYYKEPESLFASASSTVKGLHGHFNRLEADQLGSGYITSLEIGSALETGTHITELIEFLSESFDLGQKEVKLIGNKEEQLKPLVNLPVSALFGGSPVNLLYNESIKQKFRMQFASKLARRTNFSFSTTPMPIPEFNTIQELSTYKSLATTASNTIRDQVSEAIADITTHYIASPHENLLMEPETEELYNVYTEYNRQLSDSTSSQAPMSALSRRHAQWRALKLAGALTIFRKSSSVSTGDLIYAINVCELFANDLALFESELTKEPYQLFSDFMRTSATNGEHQLSIHDLRKKGYITASTSKTKLQELCTNAASYDQDGLYSVCELGICYKLIERTPINGVSFLQVSGTKSQRAKQCATGFSYAETTFPALADMLRGDFAYSPFNFKDGIRSKDNIISGAKWLALDIDDSPIKASEMHYILQDLNHHIALTSDSTNEFKYRLLVELDSFVDLEDTQWKHFTKSIAEDLSITIDNLPRSQIFFSYSAIEVLSVTDKSPLPTKDHIMTALANSDQIKATPKLTAAQSKAALSDSMETFSRAYNASSGDRTKSMIWAAFKAHELGATNSEIEILLRDINDFIIPSIAESDFKHTILSVIKRL